MGILLKSGTLLTGDSGKVVKDILIEGSHVKEIADNIQTDNHEVIDVKGHLVTPGLVDLHIHLREPGGEHKETIATGTLAAAKGGFTTVAAMPNTRPVPDNVDHLEQLTNRINETAHVRVLPYASITTRQLGKELTDFPALKEAGAFAFTDDGVGIQEAGMMYEAMKLAAAHNIAIVAHCEDNSLIYKGSVHDGEFAQKHNLKGIPSICESVQIARDVLLAEASGAHYHVCHISTKESVRVVRDAKRAGIHVTAEVTPHHLLLCDEDIPGVDPQFKMNPPLRSKEDRAALIEGLLDGTIDFIATDHAPHTEEEKAVGIEKAPFGIVGLETAFPLLYTNLVEKGICSLNFLVEALTKKPANAFNLPYGTLEAGSVADITVIDIEDSKQIDPNEFLSKGKNTPFTSWNCKGWPIVTIYNGKCIWEKGRVDV
jgi:dihydroorotase